MCELADEENGNLPPAIQTKSLNLGSRYAEPLLILNPGVFLGLVRTQKRTNRISAFFLCLLALRQALNLGV